MPDDKMSFLEAAADVSTIFIPVPFLLSPIHNSLSRQSILLVPPFTMIPIM